MLWCGGCCDGGGGCCCCWIFEVMPPCVTSVVEARAGWMDVADDDCVDVGAVEVGIILLVWIFTEIRKRQTFLSRKMRGMFFYWWNINLLGILVKFGCAFFTWRKRLPLPMNALPHWLQLNGFSPVWDRRWDTKWPLDIKSFGQRSQRNGRSALMPLLWLRLWNSKFPFRGKDFPHSSHSYGRSPVWQRLERETKQIFNQKLESEWLYKAIALWGDWKALKSQQLPHVCNQIFFASEWLIAHSADMWIISRMMFQMIIQMFFTCERFVAILATMWALAGVNHFMVF